MADNKDILDGGGSSFVGAADELSDSSFSPKMTLLSGDSSPTPYRIDQALGSLTESAPASDTASSGLNGRLQRLAQRFTSLLALLPASLGSKAAASSLAVTDSTEDIARIGIITETAPASDTASSGLNGRLQRIAQHFSTFLGRFPAALGAATAAASLPVVLSSDGPFALQTGSLTESAPGTDTASSGLNGRLQRIAQRLTSLIALLPAALTGSGNLKVAILEALTAGEAHLGAVGFHTTNPAFTQFGRLADTNVYAIGDLVANDTNGSNVVVLQFTVPRVAAGSFLVTGGQLRKSTAVVTGALFRMRLYSAAPTILAGAGNGDNAVFATVVSGNANCIGVLEFYQMFGHADGAVSFGVPDVGGYRGIKLASGSTVYGLIEARGLYTPGSAETFNGYLEIQQD